MEIEISVDNFKTKNFNLKEAVKIQNSKKQGLAVFPVKKRIV